MSEERRAYFRKAELVNGRFAMMGFLIGITTELLTGTGILGQVGALFHGHGG